MTERLVAGAAFSSEKNAGHEAWLTTAKVGPLGVEVISMHKVGAHALANEVGQRTGIAAFGIDCPFSVPIDFANFIAAKLLHPDFQSWQELAQQLVFITFDDFLAWLKEFKKEPKRFTDNQPPAQAISPLHRGTPYMAQVTYQAIRLLAMLDPQKFFVLPFQNPVPFGCAVIEVYPGATLQALHLPQDYKSTDKKQVEQMRAHRQQIIKGLASLKERKGITYANYPKISLARSMENHAIESDIALNSLLCAYTTAAFLEAPILFPDPLATDNLDVLTEGWIYYMEAPEGKK